MVNRRIQEIIAYLGYSGSNEKLTYWRTYTGLEVDAVLGDAKVAVEIKSVEEIKTKHRKTTPDHEHITDGLERLMTRDCFDRPKDVCFDMTS